MVTLEQLLNDITCTIHGDNTSHLDSIEVTGVTSDSRKAFRGNLFVAIKGSGADGHLFLKQASDNGCPAVVVENDLPDDALPGIIIIVVKDTHHALGLLASAFHGHPARRLTMIGITGTNGKTTTSWILEHLLSDNGIGTGIIGTVQYRYSGPDNQLICRDGSLTTPEPTMLHQLLKEMADNGVTHVVMEVSSHALSQQRVAGILFDVTIFTNLSRDHLDFHPSMEDYFTAKTSLFLDFLKPDGIAILTMPDQDPEDRTGEWSTRLRSLLEQNRFQAFHEPADASCRRLLTCGTNPELYFSGQDLQLEPTRSTFRLQLDQSRIRVTTPLVGRHNILNALGAAAAAYALGLTPESIGVSLGSTPSVPGRLDSVTLPDNRLKDCLPAVFVDFAHSPDSLETVLSTLRNVTRGRLICVFGCGGDRDRGKRAQMGAIAARLADISLLTSDNPRTEDPVAILKEIEQGFLQNDLTMSTIDQLFFTSTKLPGYTILADRRTAIRTCCSLATPEDVVLIAGKGHEKYQLTGTTKTYFDDRQEAIDGLLCWNLDHLLRATGGVLVNGGQRKPLTAITTDTRTISDNEVFVALAGETFDGHDFLDTALQRGAGAVLVHRDITPCDSDAAVIKVGDTLRALGDLAAYRRRLLGSALTVAAITGSCGKTTVKEMTASMLRLHFDTNDQALDPLLVTQGNFNNLVGLPLTLLKVGAKHRVAVLEMGMNRPGEIRRLTEIAQPDVGVITNIQAAHLEGLGTIENVAKAKLELFETMDSSATRIINLDDEHLRNWAVTSTLPHFTITTIPGADEFRSPVTVSDVHDLHEKGMRFTLRVRECEHQIFLPSPGPHSVRNGLIAAAIADYCGVESETIARALGSYRSYDKRMELEQLPGGINIVNDAYNANPGSMSAALNTVSGFGDSSRHVAILGDMLELGDNARSAHFSMGELVSGCEYDYLAVTGKFAAAVMEGALSGGMVPENIRVFESKQDLSDWILDLIEHNRIGADDWILLKGSRGMRMEEVLVTLRDNLNNQKQ